MQSTGPTPVNTTVKQAPSKRNQLILQMIASVAAMRLIGAGTVMNFGKDYILPLLLNKIAGGQPHWFISLSIPLVYGKYFALPAVTEYLEQLMKDHGPIVYALGPAKVLAINYAPELLSALHEKLENSEILDVAGDFFDLMHGQADDAIVQKYQHTLAAQTFDSLGSSVVGGITGSSQWLMAKAGNVASKFFNRQSVQRPAP